MFYSNYRIPFVIVCAASKETVLGTRRVGLLDDDCLHSLPHVAWCTTILPHHPFNNSPTLPGEEIARKTFLPSVHLEVVGVAHYSLNDPPSSAGPGNFMLVRFKL